MNSGVVAAWGLEAIIIAIRDLAQEKRFPFPSELLSSFVVFGALAVIGQNDTARRPATAVAWGLVIATFLSSKVDFLGPVGKFLDPAGTAANSPLTQGIEQTAQSLQQTNLGTIKG